MSSSTAADNFDPTEWSKKDFTERVRIGTNCLRAARASPTRFAVYLFHAVKLALFVLGWMFFCSFTPGLGTLVELHHVDLRGDRVPEGLPVGEPRRGARLRLHERAARAARSGRRSPRCSTSCARARRSWRRFRTCRSFGGTTRTWLDVAPLRRARRSRCSARSSRRRSPPRISCRSSSCSRSAGSPTRRSSSPRGSSTTSR